MKQDIQAEHTEIYALNAIKFICAIMVVAIHIPFVASPHLLFLYRVAVPMFFMISGYFMVDSSGNIPLKRITKTAKKTLTVTVAVNLVYYVFKAIVYKIYTWPLLDLVLEGGTIVAVLWYMNAYLFALAVIWLMVRLKIEKLLPVFIPIGLLLNLGLGSYYWLFFDTPPVITLTESVNRYILSRNFLTIALPCISAGIFIKLKERPISVVALGMISIIMLSALFIEDRTIDKGYGDITLLTVPFAACIFLLAINIRNDINAIQVLARLGKRHSTNLFLFHLLAHAVLMLVVIRLPFDLPDMDYWRLPATVTVVILADTLYSYLIPKIRLNIEHLVA